MKLYLVRHGEAVAEDVDPARPLSAAGRREVEGVARVLTRMHVQPAAVIHSGKLRARQTAEVLADALGAHDALEEGEDLTPNADPRRWAARSGERPDVMLVGHLPHLARLLSGLAGVPEEAELARIATGTALCLSRGKRSDRWQIGWMLTPSLAETLGP